MCHVQLWSSIALNPNLPAEERSAVSAWSRCTGEFLAWQNGTGCGWRRDNGACVLESELGVATSRQPYHHQHLSSPTSTHPPPALQVPFVLLLQSMGQQYREKFRDRIMRDVSAAPAAPGCPRPLLAASSFDEALPVPPQFCRYCTKRSVGWVRCWGRAPALACPAINASALRSTPDPAAAKAPHHPAPRQR